MSENKQKSKTVLKKPENPNLVNMKKGDRTIRVNKNKEHVEIMTKNGWKKV